MWLERKRFSHGIELSDEKAATAKAPIRPVPFSPLLSLPLLQHAGRPSIPVVRRGDQVTRGQLIASADGFVSVPLHASASGVVRSILHARTAEGVMRPAIVIEPYPASTQELLEGTPCELSRVTAEGVVEAVCDAGIVGLGGAAFPTHVKLHAHLERDIDTVLLNGAECEPYLTTDHRIMLEHSSDVWQGLRYLMHAAEARRGIVAVEANKADAAAALQVAQPDDLDAEVMMLPVKYPQGAERLLVSSVLGRRIPTGGLPADVGVVCVNVSTAAEIGRLLPRGRGIQERVVTVSGPAVTHPGNYRTPIGTPVRFLLEHAGLSADASRVIRGGPMMGEPLASLDVPVTKGATGFLAFPADALDTPKQAYPCIRCARCVDACPLMLNPAEMWALGRNGRFGDMQSRYALNECFECGACAYVCPAHIPLVQIFRLAKSQLRRVSV